MNNRGLPDNLKKFQDEKRQATLLKIQEAINELRDDGAEVTKKKLIEMTGYSASTFSKQHVKAVLEQNKVCQYKETLKIKPVKADPAGQYEKRLERANAEINRLKEIIVVKDIKISQLEKAYAEKEENYQILLGQVHQITRKAELKGVKL